MTARRTPSAGASRGQRRGGVAQKGRAPSKGAQEWRAADAQILREGTPADLAVRLADREARGDIVRAIEDVDLPPEDALNAEALDAEIDLEDDDLTTLEDLDGVSPVDGIVGVLPGEPFSSDDFPGDDPERLELRVEDDGRCWFLRPPWIRDEAVTAAGQGDLDEIGLRIRVFDALAAWLQRERPEFLAKPEPFALAKNALDEMRQGTPSVVQGTFLILSSIGSEIAGSEGGRKKESTARSLFSRYSSAASLVWRNGGLPLDFLFGREARMAWVARAIQQFFEGRGKALDRDRFVELRGITVPRTRQGKRALAAMSITSLTIREFVARANQMVGTNWSEVMERHFVETSRKRAS